MELNAIILNGMTNIWSDQAYVKEFGFEFFFNL